MKAVLPLALMGALAVGTAAYAAGDTSSGGSGWSGHSSSSSSSQHQKMSQNDIKQIQNKLKQQGYDVGSVDGKLGHSTQQALRQFQQDKGIQATGKPDQQTLAALDVSPSGEQQGQMPQGGHSGANPGGGMSSPDTSGGEQGGDQSR